MSESLSFSLRHCSRQTLCFASANVTSRQCKTVVLITMTQMIFRSEIRSEIRAAIEADRLPWHESPHSHCLGSDRRSRQILAYVDAVRQACSITTPVLRSLLLGAFVTDLCVITMRRFQGQVIAIALMKTHHLHP